MTSQELLASLKPRKSGTVMDLVAEAGISIDPWKVKAGGKPVKNPRANPKYCYEWVFGGDKEPYVLCVWHANLAVSAGQIVYVGNFRERASRLKSHWHDPTKAINNRARSIDQALRAERFDLAAKRAYETGVGVRVMLVEGDRAGPDEIGTRASRVHYRTLDPELWFVHDYNNATGAFRLVRSISKGPGAAFADQFVARASEKKTVLASVFSRSAAVQMTALVRANGKCELCGDPAFEMTSGELYLETHHVVSLAQGGPDEPWNVVALCPNDHRRAHYSKNANRVRDQLLLILDNHFPGVRAKLLALADD